MPEHPIMYVLGGATFGMLCAIFGRLGRIIELLEILSK